MKSSWRDPPWNVLRAEVLHDAQLVLIEFEDVCEVGLHSHSRITEKYIPRLCPSRIKVEGVTRISHVIDLLSFGAFKNVRGRITHHHGERCISNFFIRGTLIGVQLAPS